MARYDYKVIPAPRRGTKARDLTTPGDRFARSVEIALGEMASAGWEFVRSETMPCDIRKGLFGTRTEMQTLLVFRRAIAPAAWSEEDTTDRVDTPAVVAPPPTLDDERLPAQPPASSGSRSVGRAPRLGPARRD